MKRNSDKLLIAMLSGIGLFIVLGIVALFFIDRNGETEYPAGSPEALTQSYLKALEDNDWEKAYSYLSESVKDFRMREAYVNRKSGGYIQDDASRRLVLESSEIKDAEAKIVISISTFRSSGPLQTSDYTTRIDFRLRKEGDEWKITSPTYPPHF